MGRTAGDVSAQLDAALLIIVHIQFASVPMRDTPDQGLVDYRDFFAQIARLGWDAPLGLEYKPVGNTD